MSPDTLPSFELPASARFVQTRRRASLTLIRPLGLSVLERTITRTPRGCTCEYFGFRNVPFYLADSDTGSRGAIELGTCKHETALIFHAADRSRRGGRPVDREEDPRIDYARSRSLYLVRAIFKRRSPARKRSKKSTATRNNDRDSTRRPLTPPQKPKAIKSLSLPLGAFNPGAMTYTEEDAAYYYVGRATYQETSACAVTRARCARKWCAYTTCDPGLRSVSLVTGLHNAEQGGILSGFRAVCIAETEKERTVF